MSTFTSSDAWIGPQEALQKLVSRCWALLEAMPPRGAQFASQLRKIMDRENNWASWKKDKCPDFSKAPLADEPVLEIGTKRKDVLTAAHVWKRRFFTPKNRDKLDIEGLVEGDILKVCKPKDREQADKPELSTNVMTRMDVRCPINHSL